MKKRILLGLLLFFTILILSSLIAIPFFAKQYFNENGKELTSRKASINSISLNLFTSSINVNDLLLYESNNIDTFVYIKKIHVNIDPISCLQQEYRIENIEIDGLYSTLILKDSLFNFNSIIDHFASDSEPEPETPSLHFYLEKISLLNTAINYNDLNLNSIVSLQKMNIQLLKGYAWNTSAIELITDLEFATGGKVTSELNYNLESSKYALNLNTNQLNLAILLPYIQDFMFIKTLKGNLSTNLQLEGNTANSSDLDISGIVGLNNIALYDSSRKVVALNHFEITIDSLNPAKDLYNIKAIKIDTPFADYEVYKDSSDNFSNLFPSTDSTVVTTTEEESESNVFVLVKDYVVETLSGIKASRFSIDTLDINNVTFNYTDNTLLQPFNYTVSETNLKALNIKSDADSLLVYCNVLLNNSGKLSASGILHPLKPEDVSVNLTINDMVMKDLSPYFYQYVAFPVTNGLFNMSCSIDVKDKKLASKNNLLLKYFELGKKQKHADAINLPIKLGVAMLKDRKGNIAMDIPVEGDLADPEYKVWKTIGKFFKELILKAASSPYKIAAGAIGNNESKKKLSIPSASTSLTQKQYSKLDQIAKTLIDKPSLTLTLNPSYNLKKETKQLALLLVKLNFLKLDTTVLTQEKIALANNVNEKDSLFVNYINTPAKEDTLLLLEEKALVQFDYNTLTQRVEQLIYQQQLSIRTHLIKAGVPTKQIPITSFTKNNSTPVKAIQFELLFEVLEDN